MKKTILIIVRGLIFLIIVTLFLGGIIAVFKGCGSVGRIRSSSITNLDQIKSKNNLTLSNIYDELIFEGIKYPDIVFRQICLETGWLKSYNAQVRNNLFGFQTSKGYIIFIDWKQSVRSYKLWQDKHYKKGDYLQFLSKIGYSENLCYTEVLKTINIKF